MYNKAENRHPAIKAMIKAKKDAARNVSLQLRKKRNNLIKTVANITIPPTKANRLIDVAMRVRIFLLKIEK